MFFVCSDNHFGFKRGSSSSRAIYSFIPSNLLSANVVAFCPVAFCPTVQLSTPYNHCKPSNSPPPKISNLYGRLSQQQLQGFLWNQDNTHQRTVLTAIMTLTWWPRDLELWPSNTHDTRSRKSTPFFRRRFLVRAICKAGSSFVRYQKPAPIRTLFYSKQQSGVHMTKMITYD